jgi:hypothetical protein
VRPLASTCATRVGLGATVSVDLCHRSGIEYLSHGFQTQGTEREDHVQLGSIEAYTRSMPPKQVKMPPESTLRPHGVDFRM